MEATITKICRKCGEEKPLNEFYKAKSNKDGLMNICNKCDNKRVKEYKKINPEKNKEYNKKHWNKYYIKNKVKINKKVKEWAKTNPDKRNAIASLYYSKLPNSAIKGIFHIEYNISRDKLLSIPNELIEAKRQNILLFREKKKQKQLQTIINN